MMAKKRPDLGPTTVRVAKNIKQVRKLRGALPLRELAERLRALGRPILPSGISKLENGQRRVDIDDLVALAIALDVSPNLLLIGPRADDEEIHLTETQDPAPAEQVWRCFMQSPHQLPPSPSPEQMRALITVVEALQAIADAGIHPDAAIDYARQQIWR